LTTEENERKKKLNNKCIRIHLHEQVNFTDVYVFILNNDFCSLVRWFLKAPNQKTVTLKRWHN